MAKFIKWMEASPDELLEDVAVRSLDSRLQPVMHFVPLAAKHPEQDVEYVHQMRVWARRASAAVSLYETLLPKRRRKWISAQLKWIRRAANDARDSDVFALRLAADQAAVGGPLAGPGPQAPLRGSAADRRSVEARTATCSRCGCRRSTAGGRAALAGPVSASTAARLSSRSSKSGRSCSSTGGFRGERPSCCARSACETKRTSADPSASARGLSARSNRCWTSSSPRPPGT